MLVWSRLASLRSCPSGPPHYSHLCRDSHGINFPLRGAEAASQRKHSGNQLGPIANTSGSAAIFLSSHKRGETLRFPAQAPRGKSMCSSSQREWTQSVGRDCPISRGAGFPFPELTAPHLTYDYTGVNFVTKPTQARRLTQLFAWALILRNSCTYMPDSFIFLFLNKCLKLKYLLFHLIPEE